MSADSNFSLSSIRAEVICPEMTKNAFLCHTTVVWRPIATEPLEYLHEPYTAWMWTPWATFLPLIVCVYLLSNFRGGLRKTHDWRRGVRIDPSRSSEVDDFRVIWKGLCDLLSSISHRFWDTRIYRLKIANFPYPTSVQPQIWFLRLLHNVILRTASEDIVLINRVIQLHLAQRMWSQSTNVTDRRTDRRTDAIHGNTAPLL